MIDSTLQFLNGYEIPGCSGDRQLDLPVHRRKYRAVYGYPIYCGYWQTALPDHSLPYGSFGETFSVEGFAQDGLAEDSVHVGDRFLLALLEWSSLSLDSRVHKLGIRFRN